MRQALTRTALVAWLLLLACSQQAGETVPPVSKQGGPLSVYVVNYPLQYFAERIGGEHVNISFPAPADVDPAYWSPDPETVAAYQDADLILLNGAAYAAWTKRASLPWAKLVDTSASFSDRIIALQGGVTHGHGPEGKHSHGSTAFTTWLDPTLASEQARVIAEAFVRARPAREAVFRAGLAALESDLRALDDRLAKIARSLGDAPVLFSHPVYQYLARRYGLNGRSLHWEPDALPDEAMWWELRKLLPTHPARIMLWEAEPLAAIRPRLRVLGVRSIVYAPCGNAPILFSHPVYQYLERRYGLNGRSLHWEPDALPDEPMWWELRKLLPTHPARIMLWEDEPLAATRPRLRVLGVQSVVYAPFTIAPAEGDWLDVMIQNADRLEAATSKSS